MAKKTKEQLKASSNSTFYDNDNGEIQPSAHRAYNDDVIDSVAVIPDWQQLSIGGMDGAITAVTTARVKDAGDFFILEVAWTSDRSEPDGAIYFNELQTGEGSAVGKDNYSNPVIFGAGEDNGMLLHCVGANLGSGHSRIIMPK